MLSSYLIAFKTENSGGSVRIMAEDKVFAGAGYPRIGEYLRRSP
jgi:hypothetical protein